MLSMKIAWRFCDKCNSKIRALYLRHFCERKIARIHENQVQKHVILIQFSNSNLQKLFTNTGPTFTTIH